MNPSACIRCRSTELVSAMIEGGAARVTVDAAHASPVSARVCLACGAVMLTATEVGRLRTEAPPEREVQEHDF